MPVTPSGFLPGTSEHTVLRLQMFLSRHWCDILVLAMITGDAEGVRIAGNRSPYRQPSIMQMVPGDYLIDIRLARPSKRALIGRAVAGGSLFRSDHDSLHPYLVLDASNLLAYILPVPGRPIAAALEGASRLELRLDDAAKLGIADNNATILADPRSWAAATASTASMALAFESLPTISSDALRRRSIPPFSRRSFIGRAAATAGALSISYLALWSSKRAQARDGRPYYREWTDPSSGPCANHNYAASHNEQGRKCGPSVADLRYCWIGGSSATAETVDAGNREGWHRYGPAPRGELYMQRPGHCYNPRDGSTWDSWRWTFSDGITYGCSDGRVCNGHMCYLHTICPWPRE